MGSANVTLYAQWAALPTYTVTYNANGATGGSVPVDSGKYLTGATVTVLSKFGNLVNTGFSFAGWNTANGSGTSYAPGGTFAMGPPTSHAVCAVVTRWFVVYRDLQRQWQYKRVCYLDPNQYQTGDEVTVYGNLGFFFRPGYVVTGWNTAADGYRAQRMPSGTRFR